MLEGLQTWDFIPEIRNFSSKPDKGRRSDIDRFRGLEEGDYFRVEGRLLDSERFELENFLRDNR